MKDLGSFARPPHSRRTCGERRGAAFGLLQSAMRGAQMERQGLARVSDACDSRWPRHRGIRLALEPARREDIGVSQLVSDFLPELHPAPFRAFRQSAREPPDRITAGKLRREAPRILRVPSVAMPAKPDDFRFPLDDDVGAPLDG